MLKSYLFIYNNDVGSRDEVKGVIDSMSNVKTWRYDMPYVFYVISEQSAEQLYQQFAAINGKKGRFMFIEASENSQGQMLEETWYLLSHKRHKPKDT